MWSLWEDKMLSCKLKGKKELWVGQWYKKIAPLLGYFVLKREREREKEDLHPSGEEACQLFLPMVS